MGKNLTHTPTWVYMGLSLWRYSSSLMERGNSIWSKDYWLCRNHNCVLLIWFDVLLIWFDQLFSLNIFIEDHLYIWLFAVDEALCHPYLAPLHDINEEPVCPMPFSFDFEQPSFTEENIKELIWRESVKFNPDSTQWGLCNILYLEKYLMTCSTILN